MIGAVDASLPMLFGMYVFVSFDACLWIDTTRMQSTHHPTVDEADDNFGLRGLIHLFLCLCKVLL
jgi:hypothetical protein